MWGQWIGGIDGTNQGFLTLNLDKDRAPRGRLLIADY